MVKTKQSGIVPATKAEESSGNAVGEKKKIGGRVSLYDNFRGFAVILYLVAMMSNIKKSFSLPFWFVHTWSPSDAAGQPAGAVQRLIPFLNLTIADFGPVLFYFIIGLTCVLAFQKRRERDGAKAAYMHVLYRSLAIIGIGCVMIFLFNALNNIGVEILERQNIDWNQLCSIGLVCLMLIPFLNRSIWTRLASGVVILTLYQLFLPTILRLLGGEEGGVAACFGFLGVTLLATVLADLQRKDWRQFAAAVGVITGAAVLLAFLLPAHYREFNTTYQIVALAGVSILFLLYFLLDKFLIKRPIPFVSWMGKNLFLYYLILQLARVGFRQILPSASVLGMIGLDAAMLAVFCALGWWLNKKNIIIKL